MNIADILRARAHEMPSQPALIFGGETLDWQALQMRVLAATWHLREQGVRAGDLVAVATRNPLAHSVLVLALSRLAATFCGVDWRLRPRERAAALGAIGATMVLADQPLQGETSPPTTLVAESWWRLPDNATAPPIAEPGTTASCLILSSGTTGVPKAVSLTHHAQAWRALLRAQDDGLTRGTRVLHVLPLSASASISGLLAQIFAGATTLFHPVLFAAGELVDALRSQRIDQVTLVPTVVRALLEASTGPGALLPELRALVTLGSAFHAEEKRAALARLTPHLYERYGSAGTGVIARATPRDHVEAPNSVGLPPSFVNVEIVDDSDRVLPAGEVGRVRVTSPGNASGYHGTSGRSERDEVFSGGRVYPGDLGRLDAAGRLYLAGRASALIISGGHNVSPEEIEGVLQAHPAVAEAAVVGRPDGRLGEVPVALIQVRRPLRPGELETHCRAQLQPHKVPVEFRLVDRLPKTPGGKVERSALAALAEPRR